MLAALLVKQVNEKGINDIIITDTFNKSSNILEQIRKTDYFNSTFYAEVKNMIVAKTILHKIIKAINVIDYTRIVRTYIGGDCSYDAIFFNCEDLFLFNLISCIKSNHPSCILCRYEEGYSSYTNTTSTSPKSKRIIQLRNNVIKNRPSLKWDKFYVFEPSLLLKKYDSEIVRINQQYAGDVCFRNFITTIFQTQTEVLKYDKKYIIFEESFNSDGYEIDDVELYAKIITSVGKDNIMVKMHPRSKSNRFSDFGIKVIEPNGVPWEAIALSGATKNSVFLALGSGSVINSRMLAGSDSRAILLYKCLRNKPSAFNDNFKIFIESFAKEYPDGLLIPDTIEQALSYL